MFSLTPFVTTARSPLHSDPVTIWAVPRLRSRLACLSKGHQTKAHAPSRVMINREPGSDVKEGSAKQQGTWTRREAGGTGGTAGSQNASSVHPWSPGITAVAGTNPAVPCKEARGKRRGGGATPPPMCRSDTMPSQIRGKSTMQGGGLQRGGYESRKKKQATG